MKGVRDFIGKCQTLLQRSGENLNMNQWWEEEREEAAGETSLQTTAHLKPIWIRPLQLQSYQVTKVSK